MMSARMIEDGEGVRAARARSRRHWRTALLSMLGAVGVAAIMILGKTGPGHTQPAYAITTVAAMAIVLPLAVYFNNRTKDELCRLNALRANSFGFYVCMFGGWAWLVLATGGLVPPPNMLVLILATSLLTMGRYLMLKIGR